MEWRRWVAAAVPTLLGIALLVAAVGEIVRYYERRDYRSYECVEPANELVGYFVRTEECALDMSRAFVEVVDGRPVAVFAPLVSLLNEDPPALWMELDSPDLLGRLRIQNWDEIDLLPWVRVGPFLGRVTELSESESESTREVGEQVRYVLREGKEPPTLESTLGGAACYGLFGLVCFGLAYWLGVVLYRDR